MKTTILPLKHSINRSHCPLALLIIPLALACFAPSPQARAQTCEQGCDLTNSNTFLGNDALISNTTGASDTAIGDSALTSNTTGIMNTANGASALFSNTTGDKNTATGFQALYTNTTGFDNTANGDSALFRNTTGFNNTATGAGALESNGIGGNNTAVGEAALQSNTIGSYNTATGVGALLFNTTGSENTAFGDAALQLNTTGGGDTAVGVNALLSNTTGNSNIALGFDAGRLTTGSNNIDLGNEGVAGEAGTIRIGTRRTQTNAYVAGISGVTVPTGIPVIVDTSGHLGTTTSSERFKDAIQPMANASEAILALKPVTFRYKHDLDPNGIPQFGLVAEQVEKVNPDLVARDEQGKPYTVRYEAVNAMLLNEFLKAHRKIQELEANAAKQQKQIEALTAGLQKVSAQLEIMKPTPQTVSR